MKMSRTSRPPLSLAGWALGLIAPLIPAAEATAGMYSHVVVVIEENHDYSQVIGNSAAPYINNTLVPGGALFTNSHGVGHPSLPNYLELFSGSNQGVTSDLAPPSSVPGVPFTTDNLGAELLHHGLTFANYSETMPSDGYTGGFYPYNGTTDKNAGDQLYAAKHNPPVYWQNDANAASTTNPSNQLPSSVNLTYDHFAGIAATGDYSGLPTVSFIEPNQIHDMHGVSPYSVPDATVVGNGDSWLQSNLDGYAQWAKANNSLLIVTWDENDFTDANHIPTIFYGAGINPGTYDEALNHYGLLSTLESLYGTGYAGDSSKYAPVTDAFAAGYAPTISPVPEPSSIALLGLGVGGMLGLRLLLRRKAC